MKKGQICKGVVKRIAFPNKAKVMITEVEDEPESSDIGKVVTVKNCLPGQEVLFRITKRREDRLAGNLISVIKKASNELSDGYCSHYGICGGCTYQSLDYDSQLEIKSKQVREIFAPIIGDDKFDDAFDMIRRSPRQYGYRNKMEFSFGDEMVDGPLTLGMHKRGSFYDVVTVKGCRIVDEDYRLILESTIDYFASVGASHYHKIRHDGYLRHLLVRKGINTGEILVCLVTSSICDGDDEKSMLEAWTFLLENLEYSGTLTGVVHIINDNVGDAINNEGSEVLYGRSYIMEELLGLRFKITPFSFFQTNSLGAEVLYETVREYITGVDSDSCLFDLYSGTGTIAQIMAPAVRRVIGVEIVEEAVEAARENATLNGLTNVEFICGDVLNVLDDVTSEPDLIILDPPRDGVNPKALRKIIDYGVNHIIYISCKPTSLARDMGLLLDSYEVERLTCVDMFPGTSGIEVVCLLSRRKPDARVKIDVDLEDYYRIKDEQKKNQASE